PRPSRRPAMSINKILAFFSVAMAFASARPAEACGTDTTPSSAVHHVIASHFAWVNEHNRQGVLALWAPGSPVTSKSALGASPKTVPIERAVDRWVTAKKPLAFKFEDVRVAGDTARARLTVAFDDASWEDLVTLRSVNGLWRIVSKSSR